MAKPKPKGHLLQVRLTDEEWEQLQALADEGQTTYTDLVRSFIRSWHEQVESLKATKPKDGQTSPNFGDRPSSQMNSAEDAQAVADSHLMADGRIVRDWHTGK